MIEATSAEQSVVHRHTIEGFGLGFVSGILCGILLLGFTVILVHLGTA